MWKALSIHLPSIHTYLPFMTQHTHTHDRALLWPMSVRVMMPRSLPLPLSYLPYWSIIPCIVSLIISFYNHPPTHISTLAAADWCSPLFSLVLFLSALSPSLSPLISWRHHHPLPSFHDVTIILSPHLVTSLSSHHDVIIIIQWLMPRSWSISIF